MLLLTERTLNDDSTLQQRRAPSGFYDDYHLQINVYQHQAAISVTLPLHDPGPACNPTDHVCNPSDDICPAYNLTDEPSHVCSPTFDLDLQRKKSPPAFFISLKTVYFCEIK